MLGVVERYAGPGLRDRLKRPDDELLLHEDLGIDSLDLIEIVTILEDVLRIPVLEGERPVLRTLGDVRRFVESAAARFR